MTSMRNANAAWSAGGGPKSMGPPERERAERVGADTWAVEPGGGGLPVPGAVKADVNVRALAGLFPQTVQVPLRVKPPGGDTWPEGIETEAGRAAVAPEGRWWVEMAPKVARSLERGSVARPRRPPWRRWRSQCRSRPDAWGGPARGGGERGKDSPTREEPPRQGRNARWRNRGRNPAGRVEWDQRFAG